MGVQLRTNAQKRSLRADWPSPLSAMQLHKELSPPKDSRSLIIIPPLFSANSTHALFYFVSLVCTRLVTIDCCTKPYLGMSIHWSKWRRTSLAIH